MDSKLAILLSITVLPTLAGYAARRLKLASEKLGEFLMIFMLVFGYAAVSFLSIWGIKLHVSDMWLPSLGMVHAILILIAGLVAARLITHDRGEIGLLGLASGFGNAGFTMGGFVAFQLYGQTGLALASIYCLAWTPITVLVTYPVARYFASEKRTSSLPRLMLRCLFDWKSLPLPVTIIALVLSASNVSRPQVIDDYRVLDILVYSTTAIAYLAIGLRLHVGGIIVLKKHIALLAGTRFALAAIVALAMVALTKLTPWPLLGIASRVYLIESFAPTAVTMVGVANIFNLKPRQASVLFVANTLMYLLFILPFVLWLFAE